MFEQGADDETVYIIDWQDPFEASMPFEPSEHRNVIGKRTLWGWLTGTLYGPVVLLGFIVVACSACDTLIDGAITLAGNYFSPEKTGDPVLPPPRDPRLRTMRRAYPAFSMSSGDLGSTLDVETEEEAHVLRQRFGQHIIRLSGQICEVYQEGIVLAGPTQYGEASRNIRCQMLLRDEFCNLKVGDTIVVKGRFERFAVNSDDLREAGLLVDCVLCR